MSKICKMLVRCSVSLPLSFSFAVIIIFFTSSTPSIVKEDEIDVFVCCPIASFHSKKRYR